MTVAHINATAKNAADDKLRQSLRRFAETHAAPATVIVVSCRCLQASNSGFRINDESDLLLIFLDDSA